MTYRIHLPTGDYTAHTEVGDGLTRVISMLSAPSRQTFLSSRRKRNDRRAHN